ncbi:hypothetical protein BT96DRAFT_937436 [Gymnopus androsaceus JB14]|uniref:Uncharacterized protein n=1 Tax=Gymnopus androsaceus JB14 TaxID=1447944 RepID=A0A6A4HW58_9AGAR|nr:hypothetical protein BT96DRAFT_937436 [Gymnopus androsaceus JB14]
MAGRPVVYYATPPQDPQSTGISGSSCWLSPYCFYDLAPLYAWWYKFKEAEIEAESDNSLPSKTVPEGTARAGKSTREKRKHKKQRQQVAAQSNSKSKPLLQKVILMHQGTNTIAVVMESLQRFYTVQQQVMKIGQEMETELQDFSKTLDCMVSYCNWMHGLHQMAYAFVAIMLPVYKAMASL